ncbi:MAG: carboxypeptidase-like regulatory domain-containing protein [Planctomycetia bacterium]|nr:carboxypeptidase-like regulatory domain-containing protein [Planctomycetia bacterium]
MNRILFTLLISAFLLPLGCNGQKRPDGMPKLMPCAITIQQDGAPVSDATILLTAKNGDCPWVVSGTTDTTGTAKIQTHSLYNGAPAGVFTVTVEKTESTAEKSDVEKLTKPYEVYSLVAKEYTDKTTSPLELTIEKKAVTQTFDLGPACRILLMKINPNEF